MRPQGYAGMTTLVQGLGLRVFGVRRQAGGLMNVMKSLNQAYCALP